MRVTRECFQQCRTAGPRRTQDNEHFARSNQAIQVFQYFDLHSFVAGDQRFDKVEGMKEDGPNGFLIICRRAVAMTSQTMEED